MDQEYSRRSMQAHLKERAVLLAKMKSLNEIAAAGKRDFQMHEQEQFDSCKRQIEEVDRWLDQHKAQFERDNAPIEYPNGIPEDRALPTDKRCCRSIFGDSRQGSAGFRNLGEYLRSVSLSPWDPRLQELRAVHGASEGEATSGGFSVPTEFSREILDLAIAESLMLKGADVWPMSSSTLLVPGYDNTRSDLSLSGFVGQFIGEGGVITPQKPKLYQVELKAAKLVVDCALTHELLADSPALQRTLNQKIAAAVAGYADQALLNGDGAGRPLGILKSPSAVIVAKESAQTAGTITFINCCDLESRMHPEFLEGSVWICSHSCRAQLRQLRMEIGLGGSLLASAFDDSGNRLLGRPILWSTRVPVLGQQGDIALVNLQSYVIGLRESFSVEMSTAALFSTDEVVIRVRVRLSGQSKLPAAVVPESGGDGLSNVCLLAERI